MTDRPEVRRSLTERFDALMESLDGPILVVTTNDGAERAGCVVGFHNQSSIEPNRYSVWLSKANRTYRVAAFADRMALHFLGPTHHELAKLFGGATGDDIDKFAHCEWTAGPGGVPLLDGVPNRIIGHKVSLVDDVTADHVCVTLAPEEVAISQRYSPLRLSAIADIEPGHDAADKPVPGSVQPAG